MRRLPSWAAGAAIVALLLPMTVRFDFRRHRALWYELFDAGHFVLLGGITLLAFFLGPLARRQFGPRLAGAAALATLVAAGTELLQPLAGRTASSRDLTNGLLGIVSATVGLWVWQRGGARGWRVLHAVATLAIGGLLLTPAWSEASGVWWRSRHFPALGRFESPTELRLWRPLGTRAAPTRLALDDSVAREGRRSLRVETSGGAWPGVRYEAGARDWSPYDAWVAEVFVQGDPVPLNVRIDDDQDCSAFDLRFNRTTRLNPGWNLVRVPIAEIATGPRTRELDVANISWVYLFAGEDDGPRTFWIDEVRLE